MRQGIDGGMCEECRDRTGYIVHHRQELTDQTLNDPELSLSWDNLEFVCKACHDRIHGYCEKQAAQESRVWFDANGIPHSR